MHRSPINPRIMKPVRFGAEGIYLDIYRAAHVLVIYLFFLAMYIGLFYRVSHNLVSRMFDFPCNFQQKFYLIMRQAIK
jgi:hypothetical protein